MIALWSRATRNPGTCRCISCIANLPVITRRTGPARIKPLWTYGVPTPAFSSTFVNQDSRTLVDVYRATEKKWKSSEVTEQNQASCARSERNNQERTLAADSPIPEDVDWDTISKAIGMDLADETVEELWKTHDTDIHIPEMLWNLLELDSRFHGPTLLEWPASTGPDVHTRYNLPPQSLWALHESRLASLRKLQTRKKLAIQELSVSLLIYKLLRDAYLLELPQKALASLLPHIQTVLQFTANENRDAAWDLRGTINRLARIPKESWPEDTMSLRTGPKFIAEPYYFQDDDGDYHHIAGQLNVALSKVFSEYEGKQGDPEILTLAIAKICHNLLVSSSAPNLHTFNILLAGFRKWKKPQFFDDVLKAIEDCKIRPNEITCAATLHHFAETDRPEDFSKYVAKMRGIGGALMLADPNTRITKTGEARLVRESGSIIFQKVYPTPMVFDALMHGVLKFAGFDRAMEIYFEMKEDDWGLDIRGLSRLLSDCILRADWQGGLAVWEEIASIRGRIKSKPLAKAYAQFLALCSVAGQTAAFNKVLSDVTKQGFDTKSLLKQARNYMNTAQQRDTYLAPAWTADNLLIAVSENMDEVTEADTAPLFEKENAESTSKYNEPQSQNAVSNNDAWTSWLEHELGGAKSVDPQKTSDSK